jgi:hypothetical protein
VNKRLLPYNLVSCLISNIQGLRTLGPNMGGYGKNTYFLCFKNLAFLQKLIDRKGRVTETKWTISRSVELGCDYKI